VAPKKRHGSTSQAKVAHRLAALAADSASRSATWINGGFRNAAFRNAAFNNGGFRNGGFGNGGWRNYQWLTCTRRILPPFA
jgi:hypothetical protein